MDKLLNSITIPHLLLSIGIAIVAIVLWIIVKKLYRKYLLEKKRGEQSKISAVSRIAFDLIRALILVMAVIVILDVNGVNVSSLIAGLGLVSAVVGLALQDGLKDIIMGTHILTDEFYKVGDVVQYGDFEGTIIFFNTRTTKIKNTQDGRILTVCNRNMSEITQMPAATQVDIDIPLSYDEDAKSIHTILGEIAERIGSIDGIKRSEYKGTQRFDDSAIIYKLRFFCDPKDRFELERSAMKTIQDSIVKAQIKIPYNQLDIHQ